MSSSPKISVITVVFNAEKIVGKTIDNVLGQEYNNLEYIIIDGASTDSTLEIIKSYGDKISKVISQKDNGIYDAMNTGLAYSTGDYVIFMNAGDYFYNSRVLYEIVTKQPGADVYYGNTKIIDSNGNEIGDRRHKPPKKLTWKSLQMGMCVSHQSILARRSLCEAFDIHYKISSDIDWTIRLLKKCKLIVNTEMYVSKFLEGGLSSRKQKQGLRERFEIMQKHYGLPLTIFNHGRILVRFIIQKFSRNSMT